MPPSNQLESESSLHANAFAVLGATTRDTPIKIANLAEERSLFLDPDVCNKARADLTSPRNRLAVEMAYLPGISPGRAASALKAISNSSAHVDDLDATPLARANMISARLEVGVIDSDDLAMAIIALADALDQVDVESLMRDINEDRAIAGIPAVREFDVIAAELQSRRRHFRRIAYTTLDGLPTLSIVAILKELAAMATELGAAHAPGLIEDIVDDYEASTQEFVRREAEAITKIISELRRNAELKRHDLSTEIERLKKLARNWSFVLSPVQMLSASKGVDHEPSVEIAVAIRSLAIDFYNEFDLDQLSCDITQLLSEQFALVKTFQVQIDEDRETLTTLIDAKAEARQRVELKQAELDQQMYYSAEIGLLFTKRLEITSKQITWGEQSYALDVITGLRWGGTRHSVNGIPTGTTYSICLTMPMDSVVISLRDGNKYSAIIDRLWRGVGVRIAGNIIRLLKEGQTVTLGIVTILDSGIVFDRKRMFSPAESVRIGWSEMSIWSENGCFVMGKRSDKSTAARLSYSSSENVVVLDNLIRAFFKSGKPLLSQLFD